MHSRVKTSAGGQGQWRRRRLPIPHAPTSHTSARHHPQPRESHRPGTPAEGVHFGFSGRQGIISILFNWNGKEKNVIMFYSHKRCCSMPRCVCESLRPQPRFTYYFSSPPGKLHNSFL